MFLKYLYGGMYEPELKIIDVFIYKLRKKLAETTAEKPYRNFQGTWICFAISCSGKQNDFGGCWMIKESLDGFNNPSYTLDR